MSIEGEPSQYGQSHSDQPGLFPRLYTYKLNLLDPQGHILHQWGDGGTYTAKKTRDSKVVYDYDPLAGKKGHNAETTTHHVQLSIRQHFKGPQGRAVVIIRHRVGDREGDLNGPHLLGPSEGLHLPGGVLLYHGDLRPRRRKR